MKQIWIVTEQFHREPAVIRGVFDSPSKAERRVKDTLESEDYCIYSWKKVDLRKWTDETRDIEINMYFVE